MKKIIYLFVFFSYNIALAQNPHYDVCSNAYELCAGNTIQATNYNATADGAGTCFTVESSVWFKFTTDSDGGDVDVTISNIDCLEFRNWDDDLQGTLYSATAACDESTFTALDCRIQEPSGFTLSATGLPANALYYVLIDGDDNFGSETSAECEFDIVATGTGIENSNCCAPIVFNPYFEYPTCGQSNGRINLDISPKLGGESFLWSNATNSYEITGSPTGSYSVTITRGSCSFDTTFVLYEDPGITGVELSVAAQSCDETTCRYTGPELLINELLVQPSSVETENAMFDSGFGGGGAEWIELYNPNPCEALDISCYVIGNYLRDQFSYNRTDDEPATFVIPDGTTIPALGFLTIGGSNSGAQLIMDNSPANFFGERMILAVGQEHGGWIGVWDDLENPLDAVFWSLDKNMLLNNALDNSFNRDIPAPVDGTVTGCSNSSTFTTARDIYMGGKGVFIQTHMWKAGTTTYRNGDGEVYWTANPGGTGNNTQGTCNLSCEQFVDGTDAYVKIRNITGGTAPYTVDWGSGFQSSRSLTGVETGTYSVTIRDANGCEFVKNYIVENIQQPNIVSDNIEIADCNNNNGSATVVVEDGHGAYTFAWEDNSNAGTIISTDSIVTGLAFGTYNVSVTNNDNSCPDTYSITLDAANCVLPVELLSFEGEIDGNSNILNWSTAEEIDLNRYEIQVSQDGTDFETIGNVLPLGSNSDYDYSDDSPVQKGFYRLKIIDNDGSVKYSNVILLVRNTEKLIIENVYPNPVKNQLSIELITNEINSEITISITDVTGKELRNESQSLSKGFNTINLELSELASGTYFMVINDGNQVVTKKIEKI